MTIDQKAPPIARRLGSQSVLVLLGNIFTLAIGLPLQIYVSRILGAGGLGVYGLLEGAVNTISGLRYGRNIWRRSRWNICAAVEGTHTWML